MLTPSATIKRNHYLLATALLAIATFAFTLISMWPTANSIVGIWNTSSTFTHGFFVLPAFFYLVWSKRTSLQATPISMDWRTIPLIVAFSCLWLLAQQSGIQVIEHIALVSILILGIWATVGAQTAKKIAFPLMFLIFLAPVGEELVPSLMELTADFTVWAVASSGVPIYREGLFFSLPSGDWSVVEACSGIRYLIASIMLGSIYAYLNYTSIYRRVVFIGISVVLPIIANSIRAYLIVMLGHLSGNKLATGVDHLVYGWLFFGIIMFALFTIGAFFSDKEQPDSRAQLTTNATASIGKNETKQSIIKTAISWLLILSAIAIGPLWSAQITRNTTVDSQIPSNEILRNLLPESVEACSSHADETPTNWEPLINGFNHRLEANYTEGSSEVKALAFVYYNQKQGREMVSSTNRLTSGTESHWRVIDQKAFVIGKSQKLQALQMSSAKADIKALRWYSVNGVVTSSPVMAKLLEVKNKLLLKQIISVHYFITLNSSDKHSEATLEKVAKKLTL